MNISEPYKLELSPAIERTAEYDPRLGYIRFQNSETQFHGFDFATHRMRTIELGTQFSSSKADISQDLVVMISTDLPACVGLLLFVHLQYFIKRLCLFSTQDVTVHLRTYSDFSPHPSTQFSSWTIRLPPGHPLACYDEQIKILGDLLAIRFDHVTSPQTTIMIWNWKSCIPLNRIIIYGTCSCGFISHDCFTVFNSWAQGGGITSVTLFVYNNIQQPQASTPTDVFIAADCAILSPSVELCFPSRRADLLLSIVQHSTWSHRKSCAEGSSDFRPNLNPSVLHFTLAFYMVPFTGERTLPYKLFKIFASREKLLKYAALPALSTRRPMSIPWQEWGEHSTRWFSYVQTPSLEVLLNRWAMEGTRAIAVNYLTHAEDEHNYPYDYLTLLDFHPPTTRRVPNTQNAYSSIWKNDVPRHVDRDSSQEDLARVIVTLEADSEQGDVFVDVINEDAPSVTMGFEGGAVVSRLPYRMVTRRIERKRHTRWDLDETRILNVPVSCRSFSLLGQDLTSTVL